MDDIISFVADGAKAIKAIADAVADVTASKITPTQARAAFEDMLAQLAASDRMQDQALLAKFPKPDGP